MLDNNVPAYDLVNTDQLTQQVDDCTAVESYLYVFFTLLGGDSIVFPTDNFKSNLIGTLVVAIYNFFLETILFKGIVVGRIIAKLPQYIKQSEGYLCLIHLKTIMIMEEIWCFNWSSCNWGLSVKSVRDWISNYITGLFYLPLPKDKSSKKNTQLIISTCSKG